MSARGVAGHVGVENCGVGNWQQHYDSQLTALS